VNSGVEDKVGWGVTVVALAVMGLSIFNAMTLPINHDAAWLLHVSREVLSGARLYSDIIEINPPLIVWVGIPVILLERATGLSHTVLFPALIASGAVLSLAAANRLARPILGEQTSRSFLLGSALGLFVVPSFYWGQREHIMLLLTLPYIVAAATRAQGVPPPNTWLIGLVGGLGFVLKPHFAVAYVALEAWVYIRQRQIWSGSVVAATMMVTYGLVVALCTDYVSFVLFLGDEYRLFAAKPTTLIVKDARFLYSAAALSVGVVAARREHLSIALGIATGAWLFAVLSQGKGFDYHFLPALSGGILLLSLAAHRTPCHPFRLVITATVTLMIGSFPVMFSSPANDERWREIKEVQSMVSGGSAIVLTPAFEAAWPHFGYTGARWPAPIPCVWPILTTDRGRQLAQTAMTKVIQDGVPALIPVNPALDALPLLLDDPDFERAWARYSRVSRGSFYELYVVPD
jgi:hypothetical protein